jgi:hypothetical protein
MSVFSSKVAFQVRMGGANRKGMASTMPKHNR